MNHWKRIGWFSVGLVLLLTLAWILQYFSEPSVNEVPTNSNAPITSVAPNPKPPRPPAESIQQQPAVVEQQDDIAFISEPSTMAPAVKDTTISGLSFQLDPSTEYMTSDDIEFI